MQKENLKAEQPNIPQASAVANGGIPAGDAAVTLGPKAEQKETTQRMHIMDSWGGKWVKRILYYGIGFVGNSSLSVFTTYYVNPKPKAREIRENITNAAHNAISGGKETGLLKYIADGVRSGMEILFMMIAGVTATLIMTPLVSRQEKLAYQLNKLAGKDTDILPESMIEKPTPVTVEEKIRAEVDKRVNKHQNAGDLWKARLTSMAVVLGLDQVVNITNRKLEDSNLPSLDTAIWRGGQQLYRVLPKGATDAQAKWFASHGAGMKDIKASMKDQFERLEHMEKTAPGNDGKTLNEPRMVVTEQSRLLTKEVGWTFILANWVDKWTEGFRRRRVQRQTAHALEKMQKQGFIPEGYEVLLEPDGKVTVKGPESESIKDKPFVIEVTPEQAAKISADVAERPLSKEELEKDYRSIAAKDLAQAQEEERSARMTHKVESKKDKPVEPRPEKHSDAVMLDIEAMIPAR